MKIQEFIGNYLEKRLDDRKALLIYDPEGLYRNIIMALADDKITVVDGSASTIIGREKTLDAWCRLGQKDGDDMRLVVYLPIRKPFTESEQQENPYQIVALGGREFPAGDGESYQALCRQAAPDLAPQIDKLFDAGIPDFETVNNLIAGGANWPKLKTLLKAESAAEILVAIMAPSKRQESTLTSDSTWLPEFRQFLSAVLDCKLKTKSAKFPTVSTEVWRLLLFSEFAMDLPGPLPEALKDVPRAGEKFSNLVFAVCDNLRSSERHQQLYMEKAERMADELKIEHHMAGISKLGQRDTFAFEERVYLKVFVDAVFAADYEAAGRIAKHRARSIWVRHRGERQQLWTVADRALQLLVAAEDLMPEIKAADDKTDPIFELYCARFRRIDRLHRDFEQAVADAYGEFDVLEKLVEKARKQYFKAAESLQTRFLEAVQEEGWPVSGRIRHSEVFDRFVAPWLKERQKVAYFMVDALRYELAVELENELSSNWATGTTAVCAQLPTLTSVGMAALMPGADGKLTLVKDKEELVPHVNGEKVLVPKDRFRFMQKTYGDRCHMRDLDELVTKQRVKIPDTTQLLVIKTTDIDQFGEINPLEARRLIPRLTQKIIAAVNRTQKLGFDRAVIATDHGFVLFDDQQAGDGVLKPQGEWDMVKTRCLLGKCSVAEGVQAFGRNEVGIDGDFEDYVVPRSFGTFVKGSPYAHEGLSLQECVLPVISIDFGKQSPEPVNTNIDISLTYKGGATNKITTRRPMIEVSMFSAMFEETIEFQLEAYADKNLVGEIAASPYVNAATNMVAIRPGQAVKVPLKMEDDFHGNFEVRAVDPITRVNYATLKLKTDYMD